VRIPLATIKSRLARAGLRGREALAGKAIHIRTLCAGPLMVKLNGYLRQMDEKLFVEGIESNASKKPS
jgi:hypothetical protein